MPWKIKKSDLINEKRFDIEISMLFKDPREMNLQLCKERGYYVWIVIFVGNISYSDFGLFDHRATRTWDRIFRCDKMGQISKFLSWRENFAPEHDASGLESIPPGNLTHFGRPTAKNLDSVVLTIVRVNGGFDRCATKIRVWSFWPSCDQELSQKGATNGGLSGIICPIEGVLLTDGIFWKGTYGSDERTFFSY